MKTAAYTICFNEINRVDRWIEYTKLFDYRVVLDTGSTDGTYEVLKKVPGIILHQQRIEPFKFQEHRNLNLKMIPEDVDWCLSPDIDEWFSINVLEEMEKTIKERPDVTNIATTRLDIYSEKVFVGPPYETPTNKIHKRHMYEWRSPIYEHLWYIGPGQEVEIYNDKIFLVHDQDTSKPRSRIYGELLIRRYQEDPTDQWNNWFLLNHLYREKDKMMYIEVAVNFCKFHVSKDDKYRIVLEDLKNICMHDSSLDYRIKTSILHELGLT
jgi:glycosyltransferase involved in cell wall biosynthesis